MTNQTADAGTVLYVGGKDSVKTLDIIAKGVIRATSDYCAVDLTAGSIIGIGEMPGSEYIFTYEVVEAVTIFSYPYESEASLVALFKSNPKLLSTLVAGSVRFAQNMQKAVLDTMEFARSEYARVSKSLEEYPALAIATGVAPREFDNVKALSAPEMLDKARGWHRDFVEDLFANEAKFRKEFYIIPSVGLGIGLTVNSYALESRDFMVEVLNYLKTLTEESRDFMMHYQALKERTVSGNSDDQENAPASNDSSISNCLHAILEFAQPNQELADRFSLELAQFIKHPERYGNGDDVRKLRRDLSNDFYELYLAVFLKTVDLEWTSIPQGIRMFLLFGFVNEGLAGSANTTKMAAISNSLKLCSDPRVFTIYEWLLLIYHGKVVPSKNEFDLDYPAYLRERKRDGTITDADEARLLNSMPDRVQFEIKNMFALGNRVTYGRITTFTPIFDKENVTRALEQSYLNASNVNAELQHIRSIDYGAFYRQGVFSMPEAGINSYFTDDEILPYVILLPNMGNRATLWQEIDSKKRNTPARMLVSIFHTEAFEDTMIRLAGEFRWEMCKTEQGVHWNDVTDPSLTSMYCDFLQFYRKNSSISQETKEKISIALKNNANNFKKVFLADYYTYIKYESQGALRLNKNSRTILFSFCPFTKEVIQAMGDNPQYSQMVAKHQTELKQKEKTLNVIVNKIQKAGLEVPEKINVQIAQLQ